MAKHRKVVGTGITKREVISYTGEDMDVAIERFACQWNAARSAGGGSFGAVVLSAERASRSILARAESPPFEADSAKDYARRILRLIDVTKAQIARADADEAARTAVDIGRLCTDAYIKSVWEDHALYGASSAARLNAAAARGNKKRQDRAKPRHATWQAMADKMKHLSASAAAKKIARKTGDNPDTIRRKIKLK